MKRTFKRYAIYNTLHVKMADEKQVWYNTQDNDMRFLHDLTNDEYVRIPWANPTQRDLQSFIKGYNFGKGKEIQFEFTVMEW